MEINQWEKRETEYCLTQLENWRALNFRKQEELISLMKQAGNLPQPEEEIRLRMSCLDRLTNGELSDYELLTIPPEDRALYGKFKKK